MKIHITKELLKKAKPKDGFSRAQEILGMEIVGSFDWKGKIQGMSIDERVWSMFLNKGITTSNKKVIKAIKNCEKKKPKQKKPAAKGAKPKFKTGNAVFKKSLCKSPKKPDVEFYISDEWRKLRARVLEKYKCKCMMCGRSPRDHGIVVHVDHIEPRSKRPDLQLDFKNLQLLCDDCNLGKGNRFNTDWRPD